MLARARLPCKKPAAENAMLRQAGRRPMVAPTYSTDQECDLLTHPKRLPHCGSLLLYPYQNFPPELPPKPSLSVLDPLELLSSLTGS